MFLQKGLFGKVSKLDVKPFINSDDGGGWDNRSGTYAIGKGYFPITLATTNLNLNNTFEKGRLNSAGPAGNDK